MADTSTTFTNWITFITALATLITAIAALFTLLEMRRQRKQSYKPDIVPVKTYFEGYFESAIFCSWKEDVIEESEKEKSSGMKIPLFNLGTGAAKNIQFTWDFEFESFIKALNSQNIEADIDIVISNSDFLEFKENNESKALVNLLPSLKDNRDYLLPASIDKEGLKISLPSAYVWLVSNYFYLRFKIFSFDLPFTIPSLNLKIEYYDIANNRYEANFSFNVGIIFFADKEPMPDFRAYIDYKAISSFELTHLPREP